MSLLSTNLLRLLGLGLLAASAIEGAKSAPTARTVNGTYEGLRLPDWDQDAFLGMPFAQPPVGPLRWRWPQSINTSFEGVRNATAYGHSCMQYGSNFDLSEDCLTINVVRPAKGNSNPSEPLPVLAWIYGGGLSLGSTADPQYNLSGIVKLSQDMGRPVVAVSMNYRLGMWGFLQTPQIVAEGSSNAGLLDQRLALRWIQENIGAFGGDPARVTVWGESAGAQSIAYQMFAHGGRDDGLFRAAILESGGPTGAQVQPLSWYAGAVENLTRAVGCWDSSSTKDQLACLRSVDQDSLFAAHPSVVWNPLLEGDFLTGYPSQLMREGRFVKVPIIAGANTDETFSLPGRQDTEEELFDAFLSWRSYALTPPTIRRLLELYPDSSDHTCQPTPPYAITNCTQRPGAGRQWRRGAAIGSDLVMVAQRRRMAELMTTVGKQKVYSYRFDQRLWDGAEWDGVKHFQNVAFSFQNVSGLLGPRPEYDGHLRLAKAIGRAYVNFVYDCDPNGLNGGGITHDGGRGKNATGDNSTSLSLQQLLPHWPAYDLERPENMVLNATGSWVEGDDWRREGIAFINTAEVTKELLG
ncbi:Alpha/Beta hydrolase protein [Apiospora marii]|uniref:Alpha/Beta hydrolase protein n=1 Tax=Apiospora marii TaxID=335849 RepID=UPI00312E0457